MNRFFKIRKAILNILANQRGIVKSAYSAYDAEIRLRRNSPENKKLKRQQRNQFNKWLNQNPTATYQQALDYYNNSILKKIT
jgi:hypothetical protein